MVEHEEQQINPKNKNKQKHGKMPFVPQTIIATFYPNLKLTISTLHFITISSVNCTI